MKAAIKGPGLKAKGYADAQTKDSCASYKLQLLVSSLPAPRGPIAVLWFGSVERERIMFISCLRCGQ